uniref:hypothetical protein n=1 Tax=Ornithinimicrobium sp. CNJ-824 TaxID=1904966 RepID=UPI00165138B1|nr:hypothetical protein [Ornithinimicrobium sp. CNJ-824]
MLYDLTTLHFETPKEDRLRKVGMSKERRVDPQVTVGLLCDPGGFPLAVHLFEGNKALECRCPPIGCAQRAEPRSRQGRQAGAQQRMASTRDDADLRIAGRGARREGRQ